MMDCQLTFTESEIQTLFGNEAAKDENSARLRDYYFKSSTYDNRGDRSSSENPGRRRVRDTIEWFGGASCSATSRNCRRLSESAAHLAIARSESRPSK